MRAAHPARHRFLEYLLEHTLAVFILGQELLDRSGSREIRAMPDQDVIVIVFIEAGIGFPIGVDTLRFRQRLDARVRGLPVALQAACQDPVEALPAVGEPLAQ